jgi:hypothetical protein
MLIQPQSKGQESERKLELGAKSIDKEKETRVKVMNKNTEHMRQECE